MSFYNQEERGRESLLIEGVADHVDILGRPDLNELILKVVAGRGEEIKDVVHSRIRVYSDRVPIFDDEEEVVVPV